MPVCLKCTVRLGHRYAGRRAEKSQREGSAGPVDFLRIMEYHYQGRAGGRPDIRPTGENHSLWRCSTSRYGRMIASFSTALTKNVVVVKAALTKAHLIHRLPRSLTFFTTTCFSASCAATAGSVLYGSWCSKLRSNCKALPHSPVCDFRAHTHAAAGHPAGLQLNILLGPRQAFVARPVDQIPWLISPHTCASLQSEGLRLTRNLAVVIFESARDTIHHRHKEVLGALSCTAS